MNKTFSWLDSSLFNQLLLRRYCNDKNTTGYCRHYHSRCRPPRPIEPGVHTMSCTELILQISRNIFLALNEYWWWDQVTIYPIKRQLSYQFMCEITIWYDDKTKVRHKKAFPQDYDYELLSLSKTKLPITTVREQTASNPFLKYRTAGRWYLNVMLEKDWNLHSILRFNEIKATGNLNSLAGI